MKVIVYVEGPSDQAAMEALLRRLLEQKLQQGRNISFIPCPQGDAKKFVVTQVPLRAANIILNDPQAIVVALPDLYPQNKGFPHETYDELCDVMYAEFGKALEKKNVTDDNRLKQRFKIFCFKHDLEALILAAKDALALRLEREQLEVSWTLPVEDQNHQLPPKRIVEKLFEDAGHKYREVSDAQLILGLADYIAVANECSQCFKPFVDFIHDL